jgi:integrase
MSFLTHTSIESIKPPTIGQVEYRDETQRGLVLRVSQGGAKTWMVRYAKNGKRRRYKLGRFPTMGLADARTAAKAYLGDVAKGEDPAQERADAKAEPTFAEFAQVYLERYAVKKRHRGLQADISMLRVDLLPAFGDWKMSAIRKPHIIAMLDRIVDRGAPASANRTKTLISKIFNFAESRGVIEYNPAVRLAAPAQKRSRNRWLTEDELRRLFAELQIESPRRQAVVLTAVLTAARPSEVLGMRWAEIDGEWWIIPGTRTKNGREHRLFLVPTVMAAINALPPPDSDFVFHSHLSRKPIEGAGTTTMFWKWFLPLLARAGIEGVQFRDLRRTVSTHMNRIGIDAVLVERILNHVQPGVAAVYNRHGYDAEKRRALLRWERELTAIITGQKHGGRVIELSA